MRLTGHDPRRRRSSPVLPAAVSGVGKYDRVAERGAFTVGTGDGSEPHT